MGRRTFDTIGEVLFWSYSNLAMADAAIHRGDPSYGRIHYMIRQKLYYGLCRGTMALSTLYNDEREKLLSQGKCSYCGSTASPSLDHLWPRSRGGLDGAENLVFACRSCNSSKRDLDLLVWSERQEHLPPLSILRRYLKLAIRYCDNGGLLEHMAADAAILDLPFDLSRIPQKLPPPTELVWAW